MQTLQEPQDYAFLDDPDTREKIEDRLKYLNEKMSIFIERSGMSEYLRVSSAVTKQLILNYFTDIKRLKDFHKIKNTQKIKIDAYLCHWILKTKPIQIVKDNDNFDARKFAVNEQFVCTLLIMSCIDEFANPEQIDIEKLNDFQKHLLYHLKYRPVDPQSLELMILAFKTAMSLYY